MNVNGVWPLIVVGLIGTSPLSSISVASTSDGDGGGLAVSGRDRIRYSFVMQADDEVTRGHDRETADIEGYVVTTETPHPWNREYGPLGDLCLAWEGDPGDRRGGPLVFFEDGPRVETNLAVLEGFVNRVTGETVEPLALENVNLQGRLRVRRSKGHLRDRIRSSERLVINATIADGPHAGASVVVRTRGGFRGLRDLSGPFTAPR